MSSEELSQLLICCEGQGHWLYDMIVPPCSIPVSIIHIMYDTGVDEKSPQKSRPLQQYVYNQVKQLEIYLLSTGSSTVEDQAGDRIRVDCLVDLSVPIETKEGIQITDRLRYFMVITLKPRLSC